MGGIWQSRAHWANMALLQFDSSDTTRFDSYSMLRIIWHEIGKWLRKALILNR